MRANVRGLSTPPREYVLTFPRLDGGLNLSELDYRLESDQSPEMRNLTWRSGVLGCRDGQVWVTEETPGTGYAVWERTFWDHAFLHIGDGIYSLAITESDGESETGTLTKLIGGVPKNGGTFFRFGDGLYYKNRGGYYKIVRSEEGFSCGAVEAYTPVIIINASPGNGAGDEYQSENRLCAGKTIWYSAEEGTTVYHLPVEKLDRVDRVEVDGVELTEGYTVDTKAGTVTFSEAPGIHNPFVPNTVRITYSKANPDAYDSVMDCPYAATYGGDQNVCVVVGGCTAQPNAYFWSGNHAVMDPGYFPMEQYNFAGDSDEPITGFGKQQNLLVVFKERSVGRAGFETTEMATGRIVLSMPYTRINDRIGCDLPGTIRLVQNNLVFCNRQQGVHFLRDSSAAYENNIVCISGKVNGGPERQGLLSAVRDGGRVAGFDDDQSYWVVADGEAYIWDYSISSYSEPSWFYYTEIGGIAFFRGTKRSYHLNREGRISVFRPVYADYGKPIEKVYRFAAQTMGGYERLKDVTGVLFTVRSDTDTRVEIEYLTDYETRRDSTPIRSWSWRFLPRNLAYRALGFQRFAVVARRRPGCRHVRHFSMRLSNNEVGADLSVVTAEILYKYQGRER